MVNVARGLQDMSMACLLVHAAIADAQGTTVFRHVAVVDVMSGTVQPDMGGANRAVLDVLLEQRRHD